MMGLPPSEVGALQLIWYSSVPPIRQAPTPEGSSGVVEGMIEVWAGGPSPPSLTALTRNVYVFPQLSP